MSMGRLNSTDQMDLIYNYCVLVFNHLLTERKALDELAGKTQSSNASLRMYFYIYACMRRGKCYKKGTSAAFTRYLIEHIYMDNGDMALLLALAAAKQNADYRISCGNEQPGIEAVCRELLAKYNQPTKYEELVKYNGKGEILSSTKNKKTISTSSNLHDNDVTITFNYGSLDFKAKGSIVDVFDQLQVLLDDFLPYLSEALKRRSLPIQQEGEKRETKQQNRNEIEQKNLLKSVGQRIVEAKPDALSLATKKDFKARMIPLLFFACELELQDVFSISDVQSIMKDAIGEDTQKKDIENVFLKRAHWFEIVHQNPRRYRLLATAKDYAKNILIE